MADQTHAQQNEDEAVRSVQAHEMPEGAPPSARDTWRWGMIAAGCALVLGIAMLICLYTLGGESAVLFGGAMLLAYICLGGMVAIVGSIGRVRERREIQKRLREES